ncbi:MAG: SCO family protein [Alphaproteobacteria bacterium]|nr:SCO family protein [Alphaproteobacteria bacterium]
MNETPAKRLLPLILALLLAACSGAAGEPPLKGARIGGPFALTDQDGRTVRDGDFAGKYRIVYFGYTHCPDICPNDLAVIGQAMRRLEKQTPTRAAKIQPLFITVDPERDTPAVMKAYTAAFHPRLVGLTGTPQQVAVAAKAYAVWFAKQPPQPGGGYAVDHSRMTVLMGPKGEPVALLPADQGAEQVAAELGKWVS